MVQPNLIIATGNLRDACKQLQPGSMLHVDELMNRRRTNPFTADGTDLRRVRLYTADGMLYSLRDGVPTLSITRRDANTVLHRIDDAFEDFQEKFQFQPTPEEVELALRSDSTVHINLSKLGLSLGYGDLMYLEVTNPFYERKLEPEEEKLARRVFGDATFNENMDYLSNAGIHTLKIGVLAPGHLRRYTDNLPQMYVSDLGLSAYGQLIVNTAHVILDDEQESCNLSYVCGKRRKD